jgi:predicted nucleotide-binding protein
MVADKRYLFVSYARPDLDRVRPLVDAVKEELDFRAIPVDVWMDISHLNPGEAWNVVIREALEASIGFLFFVSPRSMQSDWVRRELEMAAAAPDRLIIPVILYQSPDLPPALAQRQWIDFSGRRTAKVLKLTAEKIAGAVEYYLRETPQPQPVVSKAKAPVLAADIATQVRAPIEAAKGAAEYNSVFVVHGHNTEALAKLEKYLTSVGVLAVVLSRQDESPQSLFQKFLSVASQARFAIVLLSADDYGAGRKQYDTVGVGDRALQFRARQNVILELGFFYGTLGWENVFVVSQDADRVFPNFERPSDLDGVIFDSMSDVAWQNRLSARLSKAGFELSGTTEQIVGRERRERVL